MKFILDTPSNEQAQTIGIPNSPLSQALQGPIKYVEDAKVDRLPIVPAHMLNLKRALNFNADFGGCGYWRMLWPEMVLNINNIGVINSSTAMIIDPRYYQNITSVRIQRQATSMQHAFACVLRELSDRTNKFKLIYEIDDVIFREDIPDYNGSKKAFDNQEIAKNCKEIMQMCDEITVTCEYMRQYYMDKTGVKNITVIPNYAPRFWLDRFYSPQRVADNYTKFKKRPRIGYFGSGTHTDTRGVNGFRDDFTHIVDVVIKTRKEFQWVFVGTVPYQLLPYVHNGDIEHHKWTSLLEFPYLMEKMQVNATIAPLQDNTFNRCKSNIKYLEAGCFGIPCITQDIITYAMVPNRFKTGDEMIDQLRKVLRDHQYYMKQSKLARQYAEGMWLEDHIGMYKDLYQFN